MQIIKDLLVILREIGKTACDTFESRAGLDFAALNGICGEKIMARPVAKSSEKLSFVDGGAATLPVALW